jgi:hypothetical protein
VGVKGATGQGAEAGKRLHLSADDEQDDAVPEAVPLARQVSLSKETRSKLPIRCVFRIEVVKIDNVVNFFSYAL